MTEEELAAVQGFITGSRTLSNGFVRVTIDLDIPNGITFNKFFNPCWQLPVAVARLTKNVLDPS